VTSEAGAICHSKITAKSEKGNLYFSVTRKKGRGRVGSWQSQVANIECTCLPLQPTTAAQLLLDGARAFIESRIILFVYAFCDLARNDFWRENSNVIFP
jgi:hypothetical protein